MYRNELCKLLGIEVPVVGAPMGFITGPELAAAISNAGGLGIMSFSADPPPVLREKIRRLRSLTNQPFGVNVLLSGPHLPFPIEEAIDVCLDERVPVLSTFWGDPTPDATGDIGSMDFLAGQSVGLVREIAPAAELVQEFVNGAREIFAKLAGEAIPDVLPGERPGA